MKLSKSLEDINISKIVEDFFISQTSIRNDLTIRKKFTHHQIIKGDRHKIISIFNNILQNDFLDIPFHYLHNNQDQL